MVTLKMAETADGIAAARPGEPRLLVTGPAANAQVQMLRATHDAVLIGRGTALADDPLLTVRLPGMAGPRPTRIVLDPGLALPLDSRLVATAADGPLLLLTAPDAPADREAALSHRGVAVARVPAGTAGLDLPAALSELGARGFTRLLCEGGPRLASALIVAGLADRVVLIASVAPLGRPGLETLTPAARSRIENPDTYILRDEIRLGPDVMRSYECNEAACSPV